MEAPAVPEDVVIDPFMRGAVCVMCRRGVHLEAGRVACDGCGLPTDSCLCPPMAGVPTREQLERPALPAPSRPAAEVRPAGEDLEGPGDAPSELERPRPRRRRRRVPHQQVRSEQSEGRVSGESEAEARIKRRAVRRARRRRLG